MNKFLRPDRNYDLMEGIKLVPEQVEGVEFLLKNYNAIVGLQAGLGKTALTLTAAQHILNNTKDTICFIICPKSANSAFIKEITTKLKEKYSLYTAEKTEVRTGSRYLIFNYSRMDLVIKYLYAVKKKGYKVFAIVDEVHTMQSQTSAQAKALRSVRNEFSCVFGATATPLLNNIEGTYWVVDFVRPGYFGTFRDFQSRYIDYKERTINMKGGRKRRQKDIVGYRNLDELSLKLSKVVLVRRLQYNLEFIYKECDLDRYESLQYATAAKGILADELKEKDFSARLHDLQKVVDGTHPDTHSDYYYSKMRLMVDTVKECIGRGEGCIIYTEYEDTYRKLGEILEKYKKSIGYNNLYYITGKIAQKKRDEVENKLSPLDIVIITKAGCQSINLQAVNNVIFYNTPFAVGWMIQTVGRIARMDSKYNKQNIYILEAKDTIDTYKRLLVQQHADLIKTLFGKEGNLPDMDTSEKDAIKKYRTYFKRKLLWKTS